MKRKTSILLISYFCAALFMLGLFSTLQVQAAERSARDGRHGEEYAFEELCTALRRMDLSLQKAALAASPKLEASLCTEVYAQALEGRTALAELPDSFELEKTGELLGRSGDYARCLVRCAASGADWTEEERDTLRRLGELSGWAAGRLRELRASVADGLAGPEDIRKALRQLEEEMPPVPRPVCEGVYSPRQGGPALLEGKEESSEREACLLAAAFLGVPARNATPAGERGGEIPCWRIESGDYTVAVTVQGGQILQAVSRRPAGEAQLTAEEARTLSRDFLRERGYQNLRETGWSIENGCLVSSWCPVERGVRLFPDALRVAFYLDTGTLAGFDAAGYVNCHRERELPRPQAAWEDARGLLDPSLTAEDEYLALLPLDGGGEKLCFAFDCRGEDGRRWLLFSSAATGAQEEIVLLEEDERGLRSL